MDKILPYNTSFVEYGIIETGEVIVRIAKEDCLRSDEIDDINEEIEIGNYILFCFSVNL